VISQVLPDIKTHEPNYYVSIQLTFPNYNHKNFPLFYSTAFLNIAITPRRPYHLVRKIEQKTSLTADLPISIRVPLLPSHLKSFDSLVFDTGDLSDFIIHPPLHTSTTPSHHYVPFHSSEVGQSQRISHL
jgi:hypothetical protein